MQYHTKGWFDYASAANAMTAIAIGAMLVFSVAGIKAFADNVQDDIDASVSSSQTITAGGNGLAVKYWIIANNAQGSPSGCDAADGSAVTVKFEVRKDGSTDLTDDVTATPSSQSFTLCGSDNSKSTTYKSDTPGTYKVSVSASDTSGSYNTNPAEFTLTVKAATPPADETNPTISISSPNDGATLTSDSVTVEGTASDSGSGLEKVEVQVNGGSYSTASGTSTWSSSVTLTEGPNTITAKATDKAGNTATASVDVTYTPPDTTPPKLVVPTTPVTAEATGPDGAKVSYDVSATDDRDPSPKITCTADSGSEFALGTTEVTCTATDAAGNDVSKSFNVIVQDTTAPTLELPSLDPIEATGPNGAKVTYTATAKDLVDGSFAASCTPASGSEFALGPTTVTCDAKDKTGNAATAGTFIVTVQDTTAPKLTLPSAPPAAEATSKDGAEVTYAAATATDLVDGPVNVKCTPASGSTFPLGTTPVNCSATDAAGNEATGSFNVIVQDTTKPVIEVTSTISDGQQFYFGDVPATPTCKATDSGSGVNPVGCKVEGYATTVGPQTLTFTATDNAGNTATQTIKYTVLAWTIKGFYQPVDMNGVNNLVKAGSTVPLKFEVFKGSTELTDISVRDTVAQKKVTCDTGATVDEIEQYTTTGQTTLRYDTSSGQFIDNWKSPTTKNVCYQVTMTFDDGSSVAALFRTK